MGNGYWILLWDAWGDGLNMLNSRIYHNFAGTNCFQCEDEPPTEAEAREIHGLQSLGDYPHFRIIHL